MRAIVLLVVVLLAGCCTTDECTQRQNQAMGVIMSNGGFLGYPQQRAPVSVSCTTTRGITNCSGF